VRGQWFAFVSSAWAIGTVTGPLLGGGFSQNVTWRWIFWINLPFIGVASALIAIFLKLNFRTSTFTDKLRRVDWIGSVLFISSLTGFLIPLTWGGVMYSWSSWRTLFPLLLCAAGLVAFVAYEEWFEKQGGEPMIRMSILKTRTSAVTYLGTFVRKCNAFYFLLGN
jgi:MFS family permease